MLPRYKGWLTVRGFSHIGYVLAIESEISCLHCHSRDDVFCCSVPFHGPNHHQRVHDGLGYGGGSHRVLCGRDRDQNIGGDLCPYLRPDDHGSHSVCECNLDRVHKAEIAITTSSVSLSSIRETHFIRTFISSSVCRILR